MPVGASDRADEPSRVSLRRVWWIGLLAFFLLPAAWALATPYDGAYDEHDHVVRAAGVVRGQFLVAPAPGDNARHQRVPRSLVPPNFDCLRSVYHPATCLGEPPNDRSLVRVHTRAGHYNPVFYAVVGWPLAVAPTMSGVIATRLVGALLCAVFLATALITIWPLRQRLFLLVMLLSVTPMAISLNGLVNPNGLEISAAVLLWACLTCLVSGNTTVAGRNVTGRLVGCAAMATTALALGRPAGIGVIAAIVALTCVAIGDRSRLRALLRRRDLRIGALVTIVASALVMAWTLIAQVGRLGTEQSPDPRSTVDIVRLLLLSRTDFWLQQTVGVFSYATVVLPIWVLIGWGLVQGLVLLTAFMRADRRHAYTIVAIPLACLVGGIVVDLMFVRVIGFFMQGRYFLPIWVGMFFLAALAWPALPPRALRRLYLVWTPLWGVTLLIGLYLMLRRFEFGTRDETGYPAGWHPSAGEATPYIVTIVGLALVGWLVVRYLKDTARDAANGTSNDTADKTVHDTAVNQIG